MKTPMNGLDNVSSLQRDLEHFIFFQYFSIVLSHCVCKFQNELGLLQKQAYFFFPFKNSI